MEAFRSLNEKWGPKASKIVTVLLTAVTVFLLLSYMVDRTKVNYFFLALVSIAVLFYIIYVPFLKAKKGAAAVARQGGSYKVTITRLGQITPSQSEAIDLNGDRDARTIETSRLFVIRPDSAHTFCIPKRAMKEKEIEDVRTILQAYMKYKRVK